MKLKLRVANGNEHRDILLTADSAATVGAVAQRLAMRLPRPPGAGPVQGVAVERGTAAARVVGVDQTLEEAGLRSGDVIRLSSSGGQGSAVSAPVATLHVLSGPDSPRQFPLHRGTNVIGRDRGCDVRLSDALVSKRHARINVTDHVEVIDDGSANGIAIGDAVVDRAVLRPGTIMTLGDTQLSVTHHDSTSAREDGGGTVEFNRSPRLDPAYVGTELKAPEPPRPTQGTRFPIMTLAAPIMMAGMIYAITRNTMSILFVALSPMMMIGSWFENRSASRKALELGTAQFRSSLVDLSVQLQYAADMERSGRGREHPSATEIADSVRDLTPLLWTRRPEHESFLNVRLGLGTLPSRNSVEMPTTRDTVPELWNELTEVVSRFSTIDRVPVVADLREVGNIGVAGPAEASSAVLANVVAQLAVLHSPAEVVVAGVAGEHADRWDWLKWLPHVGSEFSPLEVSHLASDPADANALVSAIEQLIVDRSAETSRGDEPPPLPAFIVCIADDAPIERARLVQIAERGPSLGVHVIWHASSLERLPAACRSYVDARLDGHHETAGFVIGGRAVDDLEPERLGDAEIQAMAQRLSPVVDSGVKVDDQSDLPRSVSFLSLSGVEIGESPDAVVESWRANNSLPSEPGAPKRRRDNGLRALVGKSAAGPLHLDLRTHGPHALVGGTTGAGKSEFLQSWVLGMAANHSPSRVTFLFVDYKGGAAFADCVDLPHCVGLVTDLSPHLVRRALTSLNAELHHRELILNAKKAKDLLELERRNDPDAPPSLVIVVDEFAALVTEVPEFVDGVVNVAQRGRSLGLHLILATQRPAGVIKDNLRANTNLRVALRMADDEDSLDVVGTRVAGGFDPGLPGRGVAKTGPGRLTTFQSAYAGGHTSNDPPPPNIEIRDLEFGRGAVWEEPESPPSAGEDGPSDITRIVATVTGAAAIAQIPTPRRPWLPELSATYRLDHLPSRRTDTELVYGVRDDPKAQAQPEVAFFPDDEGNMAVFGSSGTGKSTFLRSIAFGAAVASARGGPCHVYGLDFGSRGLQMLEQLPHVGSIVPGDDTERVQRLLRMLKELADERADRFSKANASTIVEYRERTGNHDEPRILVLVDGVGALRTAYEATAWNSYWETFQSLAADGRGLGIHFVLSADRPGAVSSSLASTIQRRLVMRLSNDMDYALVDAPADGFSQTSPPGRAFLDGMEIQVGVIGGVSNVARQAAEFAKLAASMERAGITPAPPIERLAEIVLASDLPTTVDGLATLGVWDETLAPIGIQTSGSFLVSGPPLSGRTTAVATIVRSIAASEPGRRMVYLGQRRSPLATTVAWHHAATTHTAISELANELIPQVENDEPGSWLVVVEGIGDMLNTECDMAVQDLLKACRTSDQFVVAEGETSTVTGSWPLLQAVKVSRAGIALQPDQMDGDSLFKTSFPRLNRADFPPGRGLLVTGGKSYRVQVALPE